MSGRPWYKRYGADFVAGTLGLTLEEKGAYSIILDLIYDRGSGIPDEPRYIAGVCGCSVRKWNAIRERLLSTGKITAENGLISNSRAEKEIEIAAKSSDERAESGRKGGEKRAENAAKSNENNEIGQAELKHTRAFQKPEAREEENIPLRGPAALPTKSLDAEVYRVGKLVVGQKNGWIVKALRDACEFDDTYALELIQKAAEKDDPVAWLQAAIKGVKERPYKNVSNFSPAEQVIESREDREWRKREAEIYRNVL